MIVFGNSLRARFFGDKLSIKKKLREVRMPWKASSVMEERLLFVARLLDGETMTDVCRDFGISRKTGYKIFDRYKEHGLEALTDRSRRPVRNANQLPQRLESLIVRLKAEKPHWGWPALTFGLSLPRCTAQTSIAAGSIIAHRSFCSRSQAAIKSQSLGSTMRLGMACCRPR
jgi:transposase-like protein